MSDANELSITRIIDAPRALVWRCWVESELLKQWHCPKPWFVSEAKLDVRPGGASFMIFSGPNGEEQKLPGQYVDVAEGKRRVFTDAFIGDWRPKEGKPFMTGYVELEDTPDGRTKMTWGARHWTAEDVEAHKNMGFEQGWGAAAAQLNDLAKALASEQAA
ncbi:MAG: SRPBCC family protein [Hyphomonadaceae bacterium]